MSSEPRRLHPAVLALEVLSSLRGWFGIASIPWLFVLFREGFDLQRFAFLLVIIVVTLVISAVWGLLSWRATVYGIHGSAFYFKRGVLSKSERTIPLEHIQAVDQVQGVVQRLFNVVEVRIETASGGAGGAEVSLPAVGRADAARLQQELAPRAHAAAEVGPDASAPPRRVLIRKLGLGSLLLAGATSGQIGVVAPLLATVSQLFDDLLTPDFVIRIAREWLPNSVAFIVVLALGVLLVAWLVAILGTALTYARFSISRDGDHLRVTRGLLERREITIPIQRIQAVQIVENLLRQPFGMVLVKMESAGYGADAGVSTTLFPLLPRRDVEGFLRNVAPEFAVLPELRPLPSRALRRYVLRSALPALVLALPALGLLIWRDQPELAFLPLGLVLVGAVWGWVRFKGTGWEVSSDHLVLRFRNLARTVVILPRRRLQARSVSQNPLQRRASLATLAVRVARGTEFEVVDMDASDAEDVLGRLGPGPLDSGESASSLGLENLA